MFIIYFNLTKMGNVQDTALQKAIKNSLLSIETEEQVRNDESIAQKMQNEPNGFYRTDEHQPALQKAIKNSLLSIESEEQVRNDESIAQKMQNELNGFYRTDEHQPDLQKAINNSFLSIGSEEILGLGYLCRKYPFLNARGTYLNGCPVVEIDVIGNGFCGIYAILLVLILRTSDFKNRLNDTCGSSFTCEKLIGFVSNLLQVYVIPTGFTDAGTREIRSDIEKIKNIRYGGTLGQDVLMVIADLLRIQLNISKHNKDFEYQYCYENKNMLEVNIGLKGAHYYTLLMQDDVYALLRDNILDNIYKYHNDEKKNISSS